ncbi:hypothetical protein [Alkalihalophilus marmarensis]|uniref:hypothetical protein n=1 Tax=Alkalihalophilus marmarensis TaxID=521377 RepID=UPI002DBC1BD4|nr:hypothetical protein [Alkalihalophilus marmarensis]MEC2071415.1 hypothetical protein [Alkalihalophilus marmarensis]
MGFLKELGSFVGTVTGSVAGGAIKVVGEVSGSKFIGEIGDGVKNASQFAGDKLGEAASGAWDIGASVVTQDSNRMDQGFNDLGKATGDTLKAAGHTVCNVVENGANVVEGVIDRDNKQLKEGLKGLTKTAAVGAIAFGVVEAIDGDGIVSAEESVNTTADSIDPGTHNVDPHYVNGYERADGTVVEGYWRDGDGDTSVNLSKEDGGGYERSNPDGDPTNNLNS